MTTLYLDTCCLNRPFDDQSDDLIRLEAEAVLLIVYRMEIREWEWLGSEVLDFEIAQTPDVERQARVRLLAGYAHHFVRVTEVDEARAQQLERTGFGAFDALHIACAERGGADVFLTTDRQILRCAERSADLLHIQVYNPLTWLKEVLGE